MEDVYNNSCPLRFISNWKLDKQYVKQCEEDVVFEWEERITNIEEIKEKILYLENYIENCAYGKRELQELEGLKYRLAVLESESE